MMKLDVSVNIDRPIEKVFEYVTDYDSHQEWQAGLVEASVDSEGTVEVGSRYTYVTQLVGQRLETAGEITEHEPPNKHMWKATSGPFPEFHGGFLFEPMNGGTKVTMLAEGEAGGFFKMAEPLAARMLRRQLEGSLHNLKDLLESET